MTLDNKFTRADVEVVQEDKSYDGFYQLRTLHFKHRLFSEGWSKTISRELFVRHDAVGILLYDPGLDSVALIEQFRVGVYRSDIAADKDISPWLLELVAGLIDKNETPEKLVKRESIEEAGVEVKSLEPIGEYYSSPGGSNEYFYLFIGRCDLGQAGGIHGLEDEGEDIKVHVLPLKECWLLLDKGQIINAHTLIALQWLRLNQESLKKRWS